MKGGIGMSTMSFRINDSTKKEFEDICEKLGMNPSTALTIFIKKMCREQRIPFDVSVYNSDTLRILDDVKNERNLSKVFNNTEDLFNDLDDED